ncbi:MAG TPA: PDZ domain-containing protein [Steroidobacteraceae bacterium]|nr:PDZ domain-containing protein [Steroidobacteraceae bacterium]
MKQLMLVCLLAASSMAFADTPAADTAKREAEEAKTRAKLEEARARLDKAAREVAELSGQLGAHARHDVRFIAGGPSRAVLGIQVDPRSDSKGVRVLGVSPGGPAAEAGLLDSDLIIALDGVPTTGGDPDRALIEQMRKVKPEQKVKVRVVRDGKNKDLTVVARPMAFDERMFNVRLPEGAMGAIGGNFDGIQNMPMVKHFRAFVPREFGGMELASITPKLGAYFGVTEGVLVVQAPENDAFKLEDGDVLQAIDGRKPDDGGHALRILRSYKSGEKLNLTVLRQRKPVTLAVTMPERPDMGDNFMFESMMPPTPAMPAMPPSPPIPAVPGAGASTLE